MSEEPYIVFGSPSIGPEEQAAVAETLKTGWIGTGPKVHKFEEEIARYCGATSAAALGSCTAALHLSMVVSGVGPGDEVITTALTFCATANAIVHTGATPVLVDVDRASMNIDPAAIERAITSKTKAIIVVHFAGRPCDMDEIHRIAKAHNLLVIEDAAHALEAVYKGRHVGSISPLTCFSFYVTKNITTGEGGMVSSNDPELMKKVKMYGLHGMSADAWSRFSDNGYKHYQVVFPGYKYNLTDMAASIGLVQLAKIEDWLVRRNEIWAQYDDAFADIPCFVPAPQEPETRHARHLYTLLVDLGRAPIGRDELMLRLHKRGIGTGVHYRGLHLHKYYQERFKLTPEDFPHSSWISDRTLSLPLSAKLTDGEVKRIIDAVRAELRTRTTARVTNGKKIQAA